VVAEVEAVAVAVVQAVAVEVVVQVAAVEAVVGAVNLLFSTTVIFCFPYFV
jgi:hypothetical protein